MAKIFAQHKGTFLVGALLLLSAVLLFLSVRRSPGTILVITKDGKEIVREELKEGLTFRVETDAGYNLFEVKRGERGELGICCREADCPEQICVEKGTVILADDPIVCLPHRVTARLITGK